MDMKADKVISLLEKMNLSKRGTKSIKIGGLQAGNGAGEKANEGGGSRIIVREIWCLLKGVECKDLGGNCFLFTFLQGSGVQEISTKSCFTMRRRGQATCPGLSRWY